MAWRELLGSRWPRISRYHAVLRPGLLLSSPCLLMHRIPVSVDRFAARAVLALSLLLSACTRTPPTCSDHFADGTVPVVTCVVLVLLLLFLCFVGFVVLFCGFSCFPFWSAEHLTASRIEQARFL